MAQKSNPIILRLLKTNRCFDSCWFNHSNYVYLLMRDFKIRNYINGILKTMNVSSARFLMQNLHNKQKLNIFFCNLEKTRNHMNRTLKQTSGNHPTKTRKLNIHKNLLYRNDNRLRFQEAANPMFPTKKLDCVSFNLRDKKFVEPQTQSLKRETTPTFFTHDKIFSFLNKHFITCFTTGKQVVYTNLKTTDFSKKPLSWSEYVSFIQDNVPSTIPELNVYDIILGKKNGDISKNKYRILTERIKQAITIEKLQLTFMRYFLIKYYMLNPNNVVVQTKFDLVPKSRTLSSSTLLGRKAALVKITQQPVNGIIPKNVFSCSNSALNQAANHFYRPSELNIKHLFKTRLDFMLRKQPEVFPIIKHFILQKQKKKILFSFMNHKKQSYVTKALFFKESTKLQAKNIANNLNTPVLLNLNLRKHTMAPNSHVNTLVPDNAKYNKKPVLNYNSPHTGNQLQEKMHVLGYKNISFACLLCYKKHGKFFILAKSLRFSNYMEHSYLPIEYSLKNINLKVKNLAFCNKLMLNYNKTFNILIKKTKLPYSFSRNENNLDLQQIKNNKRNFITQCNMNISISKYVLVACINKQYLYTTYNDYCNIFVVNSILNEKVPTLKKQSFFPCNRKIKQDKQEFSSILNTVDVSRTPQKYDVYTRSALNKIYMCKFYDVNKTYKDKKFKVLVPNTVYKQHIECVIQKNFLSPNPINLYFFTSTNIFQNATYLMDIFVYYLEKKQPFFKLKNMVLKQLTELKPLIVKGVLVQCSGRVAMKSKKAQKAKIQTFKYGETGLHVFNSKLDFKSSNAFTSFGTIGIKIWICYF